MIAFILLCVVAGILIAGIAAPILIVKNRKILREMHDLIADFETMNPQYQEGRRAEYRGKLVALKGKIFTGDKQSLEMARDILTAFR